MEPDLELFFEALTPLGFRVRVTHERWRLITTIKHPVMLGREDAVQLTLEQPEQIRQSRSALQVFLFYRGEDTKRWVCAVAKHAAEQAFLITVY